MTRTIHLDLQSDQTRTTWSRCLRNCAAVAAGFVLAVACVMGWSFVRDARSNPLADPRLGQLKAQLAAEPENAILKEQIRQADDTIRRTFFQRRRFLVRGAWMLLAGAVVMACCAKAASQLSHRPWVPEPNSTRPDPLLTSILSRRAITIGATAVAGVLAAMAAMPRPVTPVAMAADPVTPPVPHPALQSNVDPLQQWAGFRGTLGTGIAPAGDYPVQWDGASGKGIVWKTPVPLEGHNSPVVWDGKVFLVGAAEKKREVYCFDAGSGALRWTTPLPMAGPAAQVADGTGMCPATLAVDAGRLYASFPTGEVACLDLNGKKLWSKSLGMPVNSYGHASSPRAFNGKLILQFDQGENVNQGLSSLLCLDGATGNIVWQTRRPCRSSWGTPTLFPMSTGVQILCSGNPWVMAYDLASGKEVWRAQELKGDVAPSPVYAAGMAFACQESSDLLAVRMGGSGDVTKTQIAWKYDEDLPDISSPLASEELLWVATTSGTLTCIDIKSGKQAYQHSFDDPCNASPALAGGRVYLVDERGNTFVFEATRTYTEVAKNALGQEAEGSPAFANGRIFIRGKKELFCIGK